MKLSLLIFFACSTLFPDIAFPQIDTLYYPKIGENIIDYSFKEYDNYDKPVMTLKDFRGKWLVLDFWARECGSCIESFPKMNLLNENFSKDAHVLMAGLFRGASLEDCERNAIKLKKIFLKHQKKYNLNFPVAFDGFAADVFGIHGVPFILIIDPKGKIVAKTNQIDSTSLRRIINGEMPDLYPAYSIREPKPYRDYNFNMPLMADGHVSNGGFDTAFLSRCLLTRWNKGMPVGIAVGWDESNPLERNGKMYAEAIGFDLPSLIRLAYASRPKWDSHDMLKLEFNPQLVIECKDRVVFAESIKYLSPENTYAYSISVPKGFHSGSYFKNCLLKDIETMFNFRSCIEIREIDALNVITIDRFKVNKLKSRGGESGRFDRSQSTRFKNLGLSDMISNYGLLDCFRASNDGDVSIPILDSTKLGMNLDLTIKGDISNSELVKEFLNQNGLDIVKARIPMKHIVIFDRIDR
jgi:thiol-disulfide isomerase/thioredoxin